MAVDHHFKTGKPEALWQFPLGNLNLPLSTMLGKVPYIGLLNELSKDALMTCMDTFARTTVNEKGDCPALRQHHLYCVKE